MSDQESEEEFESAQEDEGQPEEQEKTKGEAGIAPEDEKPSEGGEKEEESLVEEQEQDVKEPEAKPELVEEEKDTGVEEKQTTEAKDIRDALKALVKEDKPKESTPSGWGWGNWLSSTIADSASALGHGIQSAIHTVEESLGVPEPENLAKSKGKEEESSQEPIENEPKKPEEAADQAEPAEDSAGKESKAEETEEGMFSVFSGIGALGSALASKSSEIVSGGIDALEALGRKTMDVLSDGDPGLRKKRAALKELTGASRPVLSQLLHEAKNKAESEAAEKSHKKAPIHFSTLFDNCQGFVHLEALELLSTECATKVETDLMSLDEEKDKAIFDEVEKIKDLCKIDDEVEDPTDEFKFGAEMEPLVEALEIPFNAKKLIEMEEKIQSELESFTEEKNADATPESLYESAMRCLAELTSKSIEFLRKSAELILVPRGEESAGTETSSQRKAETLHKITVLTSQVVSVVSAKYAGVLEKALSGIEDSSDDVKNLVPSLYLEASNCTTYIQDAFQLLQPVIQLSFIQEQRVK
eukprot:m.75782 g.75782  ORF g.75782 m.75782 type:complete len:529 (+) comp35955_c0_seq1:31-1617(+)